MKKKSSENNYWRLLCQDGWMPLISFWKWWCYTYHHQRLPKDTEQVICMKDQSMTHVDRESPIATQRDHWWCTFLKWCQPLINLDSLLSEESSQEQSPLDKRSELWDQTISQERKTISMRSQFKELYWWWEEPSNIFQMFHAETLSD